MSQYAVLHYRGDVTGAELAQPGAILGHDEAGRPYEVLDAEFEPCGSCDPTVGWPDGPLFEKLNPPDRENCTLCGGSGGRTTVHLQYGTPDAIRAHLAKLQKVTVGSAS